MTIADYPELIIEASQRSGVSDLHNQGKMLVGMLEAYLNKKLRTLDQEGSSAVTTDANGDATLPSDLAEIKGVYQDDVRLPRMTYSPVENNFSGWGWYSSGSTLKTTLNGRDLTILYYATIPSLHDNGTNWLLSAEPEIYLTGLLWQAFLRAQDYEKAASAKGYLDGQVAELEKFDRTKRRGMTEIDMTGTKTAPGNDFTITPV